MSFRETSVTRYFIKITIYIIEWTKTISEKLKGVIAIDGRDITPLVPGASKKDPLHIVSACSSENGIVPGQVETDAKPNEITAVLGLLKVLDIDGNIVAIDATGCRTDIARKILDGGGDCVLALKGNRKNSLDSIKYLFD